MKTALTCFSLVALGSASVHEFVSENNFICSTCTTVADYINSGMLDEAFSVCRGRTTKKDFTNLCSKLAARSGEIKHFGLAGKKASDICALMNYCDSTFDKDWSSLAAIDNSIIEAVNSDPKSTWVAGENKYWAGATLEDVRKRLGTIVDSKYSYKLPEVQYNANVDLPTDFDSRSNWAYCANTIGHVRDQSACGSCWAFGSTEAYNDRLCIQNKSFVQLLSTEDTASCCSGISCGMSDGCNGGQPTSAWEWFTSTGVVSGGDYDDIGKTDTCSPYTLPPCAHHVTSSEYAPCPSTDYPTPRCETKCGNNGYSTPFSGDKHHATKAYSLKGVTNIMNDIYTYGTATAAFTVYQDFLTYTSGVYVHKTGSALGGHAIKIFGWGVESGQDYWYCANSWNDSWGDQGFFKILKGADECGIEDDVSGGHAT